MPTSYEQITARHRRMWGESDFQRVGVRLLPASELLAAAVDVAPGERVLDVGGGTGNTALAAARRDGDVLCTDLAPELLAYAERRAAMECLPLRTQVADAQALPFDDGAFDVVLSTFGVMFAPDQARAAAELLRVLRPGGRLGLASWTPDGAAGQLLAVVGRYAPPVPGLAPPGRWGTADGVTALLGAGTRDLRFARRSVDVTAPSYDEQWERFRRNLGPMSAVLAAASPADAASLKVEFRALWERFNRGTDGIVVPHEYLEVVAVRCSL